MDVLNYLDSMSGKDLKDRLREWKCGQHVPQSAFNHLQTEKHKIKQESNISVMVTNSFGYDPSDGITSSVNQVPYQSELFGKQNLLKSKKLIKPVKTIKPVTKKIMDKHILKYLNFSRIKEESIFHSVFMSDKVCLEFRDTIVNEDCLVNYKYYFSSSRLENSFKVTNRISDEEMEVECIIKGVVSRKNSYTKKFNEDVTNIGDVIEKRETKEQTQLSDLSVPLVNITPSNDKLSETSETPITITSERTNDHVLKTKKKEVNINKYEILKEKYIEPLETTLTDTWVDEIYRNYQIAKVEGIDLEAFKRKKSVCYVSDTNNFMITSNLPIIPEIDEIDNPRLTKEQEISFELRLWCIGMIDNFNIRDLRGEHVEYLKTVKNETEIFLKNKYNLDQNKYYMYISYMSRKKFFKIHIRHINYFGDPGNMYETFNLDQVIYNLELDTEYYKKVIFYSMNELKNNEKKDTPTIAFNRVRIRVYDNSGFSNFSHGCTTDTLINSDLNFGFIHEDNYYNYEFKLKEIFGQPQEQANFLILGDLITDDSDDNTIYQKYEAVFVVRGLIKKGVLTDELRKICRDKTKITDIPRSNILKNALGIRRDYDLYCQDERVNRLFGLINIIKHMDNFSINVGRDTINYKRWDNFGCILTQSKKWVERGDITKLQIKVYPFIISHDTGEYKFLKNIRSINENHVELLNNCRDYINDYIKLTYRIEKKYIIKYINCIPNMSVLEINISHVNAEYDLRYDRAQDLEMILFNINIKPNYYHELPFMQII